MTDYTRLSMRERCRLNILLDMGLSIGKIAKRLGRHRSTLYRELSRNHIQGYYYPGPAHRKAIARHPRKPTKLQAHKALYHHVSQRLKQGWSPEQISGRMKLDKRPYYVCPETIYRYIYLYRHKNLSQYLPSRKSKRRKRHTRQTSSCRYGEIRLITQRPEHIAKRTRLGHWEGDLIEFSHSKKKTVTTLVERKSRIVSLLKNTSKTSPAVMDKIQARLKKPKLQPCKTITFDQGSEFADYRRIEKQLRCKVYYCETRSPWQKGSNENMNGRLRRYLPRHMNLDQMTQKDLDLLADKMNNLPRKCLGFRTPKELFLKPYKLTCRTES